MILSFVVIALLLGDALTSDGDVTSNPESKQAEALIHEGFRPQPTPSEIVVVRSDRLTVDDPAWFAFQMDLAGLSTNSGQRVIDGATHGDLVTDEDAAAATSQAILDVVSSVPARRASGQVIGS